MKENQLEDYCTYLHLITKKLNPYFASQTPYIFCKEGCSRCCRKGEYPCSELEFAFLKLGYAALDLQTQKQIVAKVLKINEEKQNYKGTVFNYECPFLINDRCSVYNYRPLICRTFGLPYYDEDNNIKVPFCVYDGLNYNQVYDMERKAISVDMYKKTGYEQEPLAFNVSLKFLITKVGVETMGLDFGEEKTIIDWM